MTPFKNAKSSYVILLVLVFLVLLVSCTNSVAIPTETPVPTLSPTATVTSTPASTFTPTVTLSPTVPPTATIDPNWVAFDSEWLQLHHPQDWTVEEPLGEPDCAPGAIDCIIRLSHSPSESVEIRLTRMPLFGASSDVVQADEEDWTMRKISAASVGATNLLKLVSVDEVEVDGIKAVRRLYEYPLVDMVTGKVKDTQYNYRVLIIDGDHGYWFEMQTTSADEFDKYTEIANNMVATIAFHN